MVLCTWKNEEVDFMDSNLQRRFLRLLPCPPPSCSARCLNLFRVQNSFMAKFCKATYELHCLVYCWKKVDAKNLWSLELAGGSWSKGENKFCPPLGPKKLFLFLYIFPCPENRVDHFLFAGSIYDMNECWMSNASIFIRHIAICQPWWWAERSIRGGVLLQGDGENIVSLFE